MAALFTEEKIKLLGYLADEVYRDPGVATGIGQAYRDVGDLFPGWKELKIDNNGNINPNGRTIDLDQDVWNPLKADGYTLPEHEEVFARVSINEETGEAVIAFRGTDEHASLNSDDDDNVGLFGLGLRNGHAYATFAMGDYYLDLLQSQGYSVTITGHSKDGGLGATFAAIRGLNAYSINAAPANKLLDNIVENGLGEKTQAYYDGLGVLQVDKKYPASYISSNAILDGSNIENHATDGDFLNEQIAGNFGTEYIGEVSKIADDEGRVFQAAPLFFQSTADLLDQDTLLNPDPTGIATLVVGVNTFLRGLNMHSPAFASLLKEQKALIGLSHDLPKLGKYIFDDNLTNILAPGGQSSFIRELYFDSVKGGGIADTLIQDLEAITFLKENGLNSIGVDILTKSAFQYARNQVSYALNEVVDAKVFPDGLLQIDENGHYFVDTTILDDDGLGNDNSADNPMRFWVEGKITFTGAEVAYVDINGVPQALDMGPTIQELSTGYTRIETIDGTRHYIKEGFVYTSTDDGLFDVKTENLNAFFDVDGTQHVAYENPDNGEAFHLAIHPDGTKSIAYTGDHEHVYHFDKYHDLPPDIRGAVQRLAIGVDNELGGQIHELFGLHSELVTEGLHQTLALMAGDSGLSIIPPIPGRKPTAPGQEEEPVTQTGSAFEIASQTGISTGNNQGDIYIPQSLGAWDDYNNSELFGFVIGAHGLGLPPDVRISALGQLFQRYEQDPDALINSGLEIITEGNSEILIDLIEGKRWGAVTIIEGEGFEHQITEVIGRENISDVVTITNIDPDQGLGFWGNQVEITYPEDFFAQKAGGYFGNLLAQNLSNGNVYQDVLISSLLKTSGEHFGTFVDLIAADNLTKDALYGAIEGVDAVAAQELKSLSEGLLSNLSAKIAGTLGSLVANEFTEALDIDGVAGEIVHTAASQVSIKFVGEGLDFVFKDLNLSGFSDGGFDFSSPEIKASLANALAAYAGSKLAGELLEPESQEAAVFGSIGSAIGTFVATSTSASLASIKAALQLGTAFGPVGVAIGAFVGTIAGTFLGNLFGDDPDPQSWAQVYYNTETGQYQIGSNWGHDGGNAATSRSMAEQIIGGVNSIVEATHGGLRSISAAPSLTIGWDEGRFIVKEDGNTHVFGGARGAIEFGALKMLQNLDLVGGHAVVMRAWHNTQATNLSEFQQDIQVAEAFQNYLLDPASVIAFMLDQPDSDVAQAWASILQRAAELELHLPHEKDVDGGWFEILQARGDIDPELIPTLENHDLVLTDPITGEETRLEFVIGPGYEMVRFVGDDGNDTYQVIVDGPSIAYLAGEGGADHLIGGPGHDIITGGDGDDTLEGGDGNDFIHGGNGADLIKGQNGEDLLVGGEGDDEIYGGPGIDMIYGGGGNDMIDGNGVKDKLFGGIGDDIIHGYNGGRVYLYGEEGDDTLYGKSGDILRGGAGNDTYNLFGEQNTIIIRRDGGHDVVNLTKNTGSSNINNINWLVFGEEFGANELWFSQTNNNNDLLISVLGEDQSVLIKNYSASGYGSHLSIEIEVPEIERGINVKGIPITSLPPTGPYNLVTDTQFLAWRARDPRIDDPYENYSYTLVSQGEIGRHETYGGMGPDYLRARNYGDKQPGDRVFGDSGNDTLIGAISNDILVGGLGNDQIYASNGHDIIYAGYGDDWVEGGSDDDLIYGGAGNDTLAGHEYDDTVYGESGNDYIIGDWGDDTLYGGEGDDHITDLDGTNTLFGGAGNDLLVFNMHQKGTSFLDGGVGNDRLRYYSHNNTNAGDDINLYDGGAGHDVLEVYLNDQTLNNQAIRADLFKYKIQLDQGNLQYEFSTLNLTVSNIEELKLYYNTSYSGTVTPGNSVNMTHLISYTTLNGTDGDDTLTGSNARYLILGGAGNDIITGGTGMNHIDGGDGDDDIQGGGGLDIISGGLGNDTIFGNHGDDEITGGNGDDTIDGGRNADTIHGGSGNDILKGGLEVDILIGGAGDDTLEGGIHRDSLKGGIGNDVYIFNKGDDIDTIEDSSGVDTIRFGEGITKSDLILTDNNNDLVITFQYGLNDKIIISGHHSGTSVEKLIFHDGSEVNLVSIVPNTAEDVFTADEDQPITGNVLADNGNGADSDADGDSLTVIEQSVTSAHGVTVQILANGDFTYSPVLNFNGMDSFTYTVDDGNFKQSTGTVTINLTPVNDDPIAQNLGVSTHSQFHKIIDIIANNNPDPDGDTLSVSAVGPASHGTVIINQDNTITYNSEKTFVGVDSFTYTLDDGHGGTSTATINVNVDLAPPITGTTSAETINGTEYDDVIYAYGNRDNVDGGQGDDIIYAYHPNTSGDVVHSYHYAGRLHGGDGNDIIYASLGQDYLYGDLGSDQMIGGSGQDVLIDGWGNADDVDFMQGNAGNDLYQIRVEQGRHPGQANLVIIEDSSGYDDLSFVQVPGTHQYFGWNDVTYTRVGNSDLRLDGHNSSIGDFHVLIRDQLTDLDNDNGAGIDRIRIQSGTYKFKDYLQSYDGIIATEGTDGNDVINGITIGSPNDLIHAGLGNDTISGGSGYDKLYGEDGDDTLIGGDGNDELHGGEGRDTYIYNAGDDSNFIFETKNAENIIQFGEGITSEEIQLSHSGYDLNIHFANNPNGTIWIKDIDGIAETSTIEKIIFHDGSEMKLHNDAPVAANDQFIGTSGYILTGNLLTDNGNGVDSDINSDLLSVAGETLTTAQGGSVTIQANGDFTYFSAKSFVGEDNFSYTLQDERGLSTTGTVNLTIEEPPNQTPTIQLMDNVLNYISGEEISFMPSFSDPDGDVLSHIVTMQDGAALPSWLTYDPTTGHLQGMAPSLVNLALPLRFNASDGEFNVQHDLSLTVTSMLLGTALVDTLYGGDEADEIHGLAGDDVIDGKSGDDTIYGHQGNDTLTGRSGNDAIHGGLGNDLVDGKDGDDILHGDDGNDLIKGESGNDILYGGSGEDELRGHGGDDVLYGGDDNDTLRGDDGIDTLYGEDGDDTLLGHSGADTLYGGAGADLIYGMQDDDLIYGGLGNDTLIGGYVYSDRFASNDEVHGEEGDDIIYGRDGDDLLFGEEGADSIYGGDHDDTIFGGVGDDYLRGDRGHDEIHGGDGNDIIGGNRGNDTLYGDSGNDTLAGSEGFDFIYGGGGNDILKGEADNDHVYGGDGDDDVRGHQGHDILFGDAGNDTLTGYTGNDTLNGGAGTDILYGQDGWDTFIFDETAFDGSVDIIADFDLALDNAIDISALLDDYDPLTDALSDFVEITQNSNHSFLAVDRDGGGDTFTIIAQINNNKDLDVSTLVNNGDLIV